LHLCFAENLFGFAFNVFFVHGVSFVKRTRLEDARSRSLRTRLA